MSHKYLNDFLKNGCGIQMSQATPPIFSKLFKHMYRKFFWTFGDHCFNFSFVSDLSWSRVLEAINRYGVIFTFWKKIQKVIVRPCLMSKKYDLLTFEDFFMNFLLELKFLILSHPVTSKQPLKIVQILLVHPV